MKFFRKPNGWFSETQDGLTPVESPFGISPQTSSTAEFLAPVLPTKIICVGLNYRAHAEEMNKTIPEEPLLFMKPLTAITPPGGTVVLPPSSQEVHHEGELAIVIGKHASKISKSETDDVIFGYTIANDVTARDIQRREKRYTRAKGFDTFCPLGPCVVTADAFNPSDETIELRVNGEVRQQSSLNDFIFDIPTVVSFISHVMTLNAGDVILTGTPSGVGPMTAGDNISITISGLGTLDHSVA